MSTAPTESPRYLGRYELVHPLGQGGMGEVFLAKINGAAGFEKPCIIKTVLPALLKDRQFLDRFHHEAKVLVHLVHSSIAQVYDMGEADGTYFMALEYVAGVDLAYLLEQARAKGVPVPVPVALCIGQRMAEGLGYAHRKAGPDGTPLGIVHRDVSPHNVMVSYEGEVKVIDFGLAKSAARSKYTLPSTVMGKLGYMSPEQVRAEALDHRSDIYSCGVVLWEMLAGRPLIPHGTVGEMMAAMSQPVVPELPGLRPEVDGALDAVVRRALTAKPDERYSRSDELARALTGELVRSGASVGAEEVGQFVRSLCPEAFETQRQLIAKVTSSASHRRTPAPGTGTGVFGTGPQSPMSGFEPTMMRSLGDAQPAGERSGSGAPPSTVFVEGQETETGGTLPRPAGEQGTAVTRRPSRPVPTAQAEEAEGRKRPMGLYAAIAVLLVIATAATTALFVRQPAQGVATKDATAPATGTAAAQPTGTPATGTAGAAAQPTGANAGTAVAQPSGTVATGTAVGQPAGATGANAPTAGTAAAQPTGTPATGTAAQPTAATGANATVTGTAASASTGTVAGAAGANTPATGTAAAVTQGTAADKGAQVAAVTPGSVSPDKTASAGTEAGGGKASASTAKPPTKKKPAPAVQQVRYLSPANVLPVVDKNGKVYLERGGAGLTPGTMLEVVGPPQKNGKRAVLGKATVVGPAKGLAQPGAFKDWVFLKLDEAALEAEGALFVSVPDKVAAAPEKPEAAAAPVPAPASDAAAAKPEVVELYGHAKKEGGVGGFFGKGITVKNLSTEDWSECQVMKDRRMVGWLGDLKSTKERTVTQFKLDANRSIGSGMVGVFCKEGQFTQKLEE